MAERILLVEDEEKLARMVELELQYEGYEVEKAFDGRAGLDRALSGEFDLVLLDIMLPALSGMEVLRRLRRESAMPVIMLTARDTVVDKVSGLAMGADDYITKPFALAVLRARVNAQLRRGTPKVSPALSVDPFAFDFDRMDFRRDGVSVELSKTEQKLLRVLVENRGHTVPRAALVDRVWTDGAEVVEENALSVTVKRLRSKLESDPSKPEYLKTVYGIGYTWAVKP